jgi:hypothetical protein
MDADALDRFETGPARDDDLNDVVRMMESADRALGIPAEPVRSDAASRDRARHDLLCARGYVHVRSSFTKLKRLEADEQADTQPAGVTIRRYEEDDERALFEVNEASFADHFGFRPTSFESFNQELHGEDRDPSLVVVAAADRATVVDLYECVDMSVYNQYDALHRDRDRIVRTGSDHLRARQAAHGVWRGPPARLRYSTVGPADPEGGLKLTAPDPRQ